MSVAGRQREFGLGGAAEVSLKEARDRALEIRRAARCGELDRPKAQLLAPSFQEFAHAYVAMRSAGWKDPKRGSQIWLNSLEHHAFPIIGSVSVDAVTRDHVIQILEPIWSAKTETASRVRNRLELILGAARAKGLRSGENPAVWRDGLEHIFAPPRLVAPVRHFVAVPIDAMPALMARLRTSKGMAARLVEFIALTWVRFSAAAGARWDEVDWEARVWTVPPGRNKGRKGAVMAHRAPLSEAALDVLHRVRPRRRGRSPLIFPSPQAAKMLSDVAAKKALVRGGDPAWTTHGLRSTARDWAAERTEFPHELAEMALGHVVGNAVEAAYRRGDMLERRRPLMDEWASYCLSTCERAQRSKD